jgi:hypothetical protein
MIPCEFKEQNCIFNTPPDLDESQCGPIHASQRFIKGGNLDGAPFVVVAWKPSPEELKELQNGNPVFIGMVGGLAPHTVQTSFESFGPCT